MNLSSKHLLSTFALATVCCLGIQAQNAYLVEHFTQGIPSEFALYDVDGNEPSVDMANLGFAVGTPWICVTEGVPPMPTIAMATRYFFRPQATR